MSGARPPGALHGSIRSGSAVPRRPGAVRRGPAVAIVAAIGAVAMAARAQLVDPLDAPAERSARAALVLLNGVAAAGTRIVAVGQRGHVLTSDDGGRSWAQAAVPVSVDLTAVQFPTRERGWAVGHGGVVLATRDGGRSWVKQLDGRDVARLLDRWYGAPGRAPSPAVRRQLEMLTTSAADASFLDVWFDDERTGFAVGAFNLILRTGDGGESWEPWLHRADNPDGLHLYAIRRVGAGLYAAGERGLILKLDAAGGRLGALAVPYRGTFFGVTGDRHAVVAFGLRGHALRSVDGGASWEPVRTGVEVGITAGAAMPDGRLLLVTLGGHLLVSADGGRSFRGTPRERPLPISSVVAAGPDAVVLAGVDGARREAVR